MLYILHILYILHDLRKRHRKLQTLAISKKLSQGLEAATLGWELTAGAFSIEVTEVERRWGSLIKLSLELNQVF